MSDCLSHSCPTCETCGGLGVRTKYVQAGALEWPEQWPCPDCIDGYPREAVERAALAIAEVGPDRAFEEYALAAIRAFHNEGTE